MAAKYTMSLDMRVLQHLGIRLYSNVAAVISELVANSWDAEATEVGPEGGRLDLAPCGHDADGRTSYGRHDAVRLLPHHVCQPDAHRAAIVAWDAEVAEPEGVTVSVEMGDGE